MFFFHIYIYILVITHFHRHSARNIRCASIYIWHPLANILTGRDNWWGDASELFWFFERSFEVSFAPLPKKRIKNIYIEAHWCGLEIHWCLLHMRINSPKEVIGLSPFEPTLQVLHAPRLLHRLLSSHATPLLTRQREESYNVIKIIYVTITRVFAKL